MPGYPPPELICMLFEEQAELMAQMPSERPRGWVLAFDEWLEERWLSSTAERMELEVELEAQMPSERSWGWPQRKAPLEE